MKETRGRRRKRQRRGERREKKEFFFFSLSPSPLDKRQRRRERREGKEKMANQQRRPSTETKISLSDFVFETRTSFPSLSSPSTPPFHSPPARDRSLPLNCKFSNVHAEASNGGGRRAGQVEARRWRRAVCRKRPRGGQQRRGADKHAGIPSELPLVGDVPRRGPRDGKESKRKMAVGRQALDEACFLSLNEETSTTD